jgi:hypothetical protein
VFKEESVPHVKIKIGSFVQSEYEPELGAKFIDLLEGLIEVGVKI